MKGECVFLSLYFGVGFGWKNRPARWSNRSVRMLKAVSLAGGTFVVSC